MRHLLRSLIAFVYAATSAFSQQSSSGTVNASNALRQVFMPPSTVEDKCEKSEILNDEFKTKCKIPSTNQCDTNVLEQMYRGWQQDKRCQGFDYYERITKNLLKQSGWVYNITTNWTDYFENRANSILSSNKNNFICTFAAKKWKQVNERVFFHNVWQKNAIQCTNFLAVARRGFMCAVCDNTTQEYLSFSTEADPRDVTASPNQNRNETVILLSNQMCQSFITSCLNYISNKLYILDKLNIEFTLALCDKDGKYLAQNEKSYYKKVLPSSVIFDEEDIDNCNKYLTRDRTIDNEETKKNELACTALCDRYFTLGVMIYDDIRNLDNFQYMHEILKEIVMENFHPNLFNTKSATTTTVALDFFNLMFKFKSRSTDHGGLDLEKYARDNSYKEIDAKQFIKSAGWLSSRMLLLLIVTSLLCL